jgi:uncharacterized membrane protein YozB (DUF420 family)
MKTAAAAQPNFGFLVRFFSPILGLTVAVIAVYGFGHTVGEVFVHYTTRPPPILYVHVLVSSAWLLLFISQTTLISAGNVRMHRRLGVWGLALGTIVCLVGLMTVFVMRQRDIDSGGGPQAIAELSIPLYSLVSFAIPFLLAAWWRRRPERHRRLMMLATCSLTFAALARVPVLGDTWAPLGTDVLLVTAAGVDRYKTGRIHVVYLIGIPLMVLGEAVSLYLAAASPPAWMAVAKFLLGRA